MALAGPLTNVAIALLLVLICLPFRIGSPFSINQFSKLLSSVSWQGLVGYLAMINLILGFLADQEVS